MRRAVQSKRVAIERRTSRPSDANGFASSSRWCWPRRRADGSGRFVNCGGRTSTTRCRRSRGVPTRTRWVSFGRLISRLLVAELRRFQSRLGRAGGWVFPAARLPDQPTDRWTLVKYLLQAERDAGLPKLIGGVWHPYRRKWAMERKHWPMRDVAAVGGWNVSGVFSTVMLRPIARPCGASSTSHTSCCRLICSRRSSRRGSRGHRRRTIAETMLTEGKQAATHSAALAVSQPRCGRCDARERN